jgi:hypothetical protein
VAQERRWRVRAPSVTLAFAGKRVTLDRTADETIGIVRRVRSEQAVEPSEQEEYVRCFAQEWRVSHATGLSRMSRGPWREPTQIERYRGCLLGLAVGDALGTTLEFKPPGTFRPIDDMVGGGPFGRSHTAPGRRCHAVTI